MGGVRPSPPYYLAVMGLLLPSWPSISPPLGVRMSSFEVLERTCARMRACPREAMHRRGGRSLADAAALVLCGVV